MLQNEGISVGFPVPFPCFWDARGNRVQRRESKGGQICKSEKVRAGEDQVVLDSVAQQMPECLLRASLCQTLGAHQGTCVRVLSLCAFQWGNLRSSEVTACLKAHKRHEGIGEGEASLSELGFPEVLFQGSLAQAPSLPGKAGEQWELGIEMKRRCSGSWGSIPYPEPLLGCHSKTWSQRKGEGSTRAGSSCPHSMVAGLCGGRTGQVCRGQQRVLASRDVQTQFKLPSLLPPPGHGRAGGGVPAGREVSRPLSLIPTHRINQGPDLQVAFRAGSAFLPPSPLPVSLLPLA